MTDVKIGITGFRAKSQTPTRISNFPSRARERFWANVDTSGGMFDCWPWMGRKDDAGYARYGNGSVFGEIYVHRIAYILTHGAIPEGMDIDHVRANGCTLRSCVNAVAHLEPVTHYENCRRGSQAQQTHCKHGHDLAPEAGHLVIRTRRDGSTYRQCATCVRERARRQAR